MVIHGGKEGGKVSATRGVEVGQGEDSFKAFAVTVNRDGEGCTGAKQPSIKSNSVSHGSGRFPCSETTVV